jgi:hypothetical protein
MEPRTEDTAKAEIPVVVVHPPPPQQQQNEPSGTTTTTTTSTTILDERNTVEFVSFIEDLIELMSSPPSIESLSYLSNAAVASRMQTILSTTTTSATQQQRVGPGSVTIATTNSAVISTYYLRAVAQQLVSLLLQQQKQPNTPTTSANMVGTAPPQQQQIRTLDDSTSMILPVCFLFYFYAHVVEFTSSIGPCQSAYSLNLYINFSVYLQLSLPRPRRWLVCVYHT